MPVLFYTAIIDSNLLAGVLYMQFAFSINKHNFPLDASARPAIESRPLCLILSAFILRFTITASAKRLPLVALK
jgi:hypothetical protein